MHEIGTRPDPNGAATAGSAIWFVPHAASAASARKGHRRRPPARLLAIMAFAVGLALATLLATTTNGLRGATAFDRLAILAGFSIESVSLAGQRYTPDGDIFDALGATQGRSLLTFDSKGAKTRIERLPWVRTATITRQFPDRLTVDIVERQPFAQWERDGARHLIDETGRVLGRAASGTWAALPLISGEGAALDAATLITAFASQSGLKGRLVRAERVGERRWTLHLKGGTEVHLPADDAGAALARLEHLQREGRLLDRGIAVIDLRRPHQLVLGTEAGRAARVSN